jgi:MFS family permease
VFVLALGARETGRQVDSKLPALRLSGFDRRFKFFLIVIVLFTLGNSSDAFLVLRAQERGSSVLTILLMIFAFNVVYAVVSGPAGRLSDRVGRKRVIVAGWIIYALVYLGFGVSGATWQLFGLYAVYGLYYALTEGVARAMIADMVTREQRGTAYGLYNAAVGLTAFPASFIAGVLWQGIGPFAGFGAPAPFFFGAVLAGISAILLIIV